MSQSLVYAFGESPQGIYVINEWQDIIYNYNGILKNWNHLPDTGEFKCELTGYYNIMAQVLVNDDTAPKVDVSLRINVNGSEAPGGQTSISIGDPNICMQLRKSMIAYLLKGAIVKIQICSSSLNTKIWTHGSGFQPVNVEINIQKI